MAALRSKTDKGLTRSFSLDLQDPRFEKKSLEAFIYVQTIAANEEVHPHLSVPIEIDYNSCFPGLPRLDSTRGMITSST